MFAAVCCPPCPDCPPIAELVWLNFSSSCHPHLCKSARRRALTYATLIHSLIIVLGQSPPKSLKPARCYGLHSARSRFPLFGCIALLSSGLGLVVRLEKGLQQGLHRKEAQHVATKVPCKVKVVVLMFFVMSVPGRCWVRWGVFSDCGAVLRGCWALQTLYPEHSMSKASSSGLQGPRA